MGNNLIKTSTIKGSLVAVLIRQTEDIHHPLLEPLKIILQKKLQEKESGIVAHYSAEYILCACILKNNQKLSTSELLEEARQKGGSICRKNNHEKSNSIMLVNASASIQKSEMMACIEGIALANYQFNKYKSESKKNTLETLYINEPAISQDELDELNDVLEANAICKNLGNEPVNSLNSIQLSDYILALGNEVNFQTEILHKADIEKLKMGGLLGVNLGSKIPPTFNILTYKPANAINKNPLILVGKGVMYDTGGYSLKPAQSMAGMKGDMCGAGAVIGAFYAVAKTQLPIYLIGLIPSTDNRINSDALVPDDIIKMSDGTTVEVLNTDAEGRLILGDALHFAKQFNPELVIDLATLTGAAAAITGSLGSAMMGTDLLYRNLLIEAGEESYERVAEIPYWKEYGEMIKSDVADIKNIGGGAGGSATAGKFLEHFTNYPWIHLDIAGPSMLKEDEAYKQKGASGIGVRLLYTFAKKFLQKINNA